MIEKSIPKFHKFQLDHNEFLLLMPFSQVGHFESNVLIDNRASSKNV